MASWKEIKDPEDYDFYEVQVDETWLGDDVISDAIFIADPESGLTIEEPGIEGNKVRTAISGGNVGAHRIEVTIVTIPSNRVKQRTITLYVRER